MRNYIYKLKDDTGQTLYGFMDAHNRKDLKYRLRESGYYFITAYPYDQREIFKQKGNSEMLLIFTHRLASLIEAGVPILQAMNILWRQTEDKKLQLVISHIKYNLEAGKSISEALKDFPNIFPVIYRALIGVAEKTGGLVSILHQLSEYMHYQKEIVRRIKNATFYPMIVISFSIIILICMFRFVVPTFEKVLNKLDVDLPVITQVIINIAHILQSWTFVLAVIAIGPIIFFLYKYLRQYSWFCLYVDSMKLKIPYIGHIIYTIILGRFIQSLGILIGAGLPILDSFDAAKATIDNKKVISGINQVQKKVEKGSSLYSAFKNERIFPIMLIEMIGVGETSGKIVKVFKNLSIHFDEEVDYNIKKLLSFMEPFLIIFVGCIVIITLLAIYLPILSLWKSLSM